MESAMSTALDHREHGEDLHAPIPTSTFSAGRQTSSVPEPPSTRDDSRGDIGRPSPDVRVSVGHANAMPSGSELERYRVAIVNDESPSVAATSVAGGTPCINRVTNGTVSACTTPASLIAERTELHGRLPTAGSRACPCAARGTHAVASRAKVRSSRRGGEPRGRIARSKRDLGSTPWRDRMERPPRPEPNRSMQPTMSARFDRHHRADCDVRISTA